MMGDGAGTLAGLAFSLRAGKVSPTEAVEGALESPVVLVDPAPDLVDRAASPPADLLRYRGRLGEDPELR